MRPRLTLLLIFAAAPALAQDAAPEIANFTLRRDYAVSLAVPNLPGTRFIEFDDKGILYVSRPDRGDIIAFKDSDNDGVYETRATFVKDKASAHGLCAPPGGPPGGGPAGDGWMWFSTTGAVHKARDTTGDLMADEVVDVIPVGQLPRKGAHWWRSLLVTPSGLYTSIGDAGNISDQSDTERQKIFRFSLDGSGKTLFASGLRNTEKLRLRPGTTEVWGFDHGSDNFGFALGEDSARQPITDLIPPEELNHYVEGGFYGHPFLVGERIPRFEYREKKDLVELAARTTPPAWCVPAHWAVNGFCFIDPEANRRTGAFPEDHGGDIFFAAHGSWNSAKKVGYCIGRILFDKETGRPYAMLKIVDCLQRGDVNQPEVEIVRARPVDCAQAPDGSILFSSDGPGRIYRIRYTGDKR
jgi:glucose/arabinose dehydrogenase